MPIKICLLYGFVACRRNHARPNFPSYCLTNLIYIIFSYFVTVVCKTQSLSSAEEKKILPFSPNSDFFYSSYALSFFGKLGVWHKKNSSLTPPPPSTGQITVRHISNVSKSSRLFTDMGADMFQEGGIMPRKLFYPP